jgi:hypothetical protein
MKKHWIVGRSLLLLTIFLHLQSAFLFAQSAHFAVSPDLKMTSLTHTVLHGSNSHYNVTPFGLGEESASDDQLSPVLRAAHLPLTWKYNVVATVFWIGEQESEGNPLPNTESAWRPNWIAHCGGEDSLIQRANYVPIGFTPRQNPFYVALMASGIERRAIFLAEACLHKRSVFDVRLHNYVLMPNHYSSRSLASLIHGGG